VGHSPSSTDDLGDDTNTFRGLRNPVAVEPVSKLAQALWKLRVFDWLKSLDADDARLAEEAGDVGDRPEAHARFAGFPGF
jgi:hypothetical protein